MKVIAINGSPRKDHNTATLLNKVLEGAASQGAETEIIHLYDLNFKGCISCFTCKLKEGKNYGKCIIKDDLSPVLKKLHIADAVVLGSPIYLNNITGETRSFMERLFFPLIEYTNHPTLLPRNIPTALIYTMNISEEKMKNIHLDKYLESNELLFKKFFGKCKTLYCTDTYQFNDYSKVVSDKFDHEKKLKRHKEIFPKDCAKAFDIGTEFVNHKI
ncbi:flavodoxin [Clostridium carboxidivorans P7]|uniref:NADPH-dependent FMN reductase n=1 Tax=Clostridium carboxidivorans P7 TaxID=536227 RepID=C6PMT5_9CLOT|nr:flavodoxin family protein [Clostridium carboxidivorans]AKN29829.1 flavodoxin [Clostridium carboxidivorans P7]EET89513.1 NADPH-dependent FMN reductase [Clostridium carboxidivorans P7]